MRPALTFACGVLVLAAAGCGSANVGTPSPSACVTPPGGRIFSANGQGSGATGTFSACGRWSADLDWRCAQVSDISTTIVGGGQRLDGPVGDGLAGMNIARFTSPGTYHVVVQATSSCSWSLDILAGDD